MPEDLLIQHRLSQVVGWARLLRLVRAGWLAPAERSRTRALYRVSDVHAALRRLERQACPPDKLESIRVRAAQPYVRKAPPPKPDLNAIKLDFSVIDL